MLSNLKVIDLSTVLAGPSVGMFFAELGAEVIKIEHPIHRDVTRSWKSGNEDINASISSYFSSVNYKKKYQNLDLTNASDYAILIDLLKDADILLSNFKSSDYLKFNLTEEQLKFHNPTLIHGRVSGFGSNSDRVAYDLILQAESGFMSMNGLNNSEPIKMPVALIDVLTAHQLKEGILLALLDRKETGIGKNVHVSLYKTAVSSLVNQASNYLMTGKIPKRIGSLHPSIAPYGELFTCIDGESITFAIGSDIQFKKLLKKLSLDTYCSDQRFSSNQNRVTNRTELFDLLNLKIKEFTSTELLEWSLLNHIPCGHIKNMKEVFEQQLAQELIRSEEIDGMETKRVSSISFEIT
jgi:crotonobetainyl-CoA:carnitine CoA-transferase CaiB-like acyl-CoA transferase